MLVSENLYCKILVRFFNVGTPKAFAVGVRATIFCFEIWKVVVEKDIITI